MSSRKNIIYYYNVDLKYLLLILISTVILIIVKKLLKAVWPYGHTKRPYSMHLLKCISFDNIITWVKRTTLYRLFRPKFYRKHESEKNLHQAFKTN